MFLDMPAVVRDRMIALESKDSRDRIDGTGRLERLRQITKFRFLVNIRRMSSASYAPGELRSLRYLPWVARRSSAP